MNLSEDALRWMAYQAEICGDRDCGEAICLVAPAVAKYLHLPPMDALEAAQFGKALMQAFSNDLKKEAA